MSNSDKCRLSFFLSFFRFLSDFVNTLCFFSFDPPHLHNSQADALDADLFAPAMMEVLQLMEKKTMQQFIASDEYRTYAMLKEVSECVSE